MSQDESISLKPRLKAVGRGHSVRPTIVSSRESSNQRRPRFVSNEGDLSSSSSNNHHERGSDGIRNENDAAENLRLKGELEITRRLLLIKNSTPELKQQSIPSVQSFNPEHNESPKFISDEDEEFDSVSARDVITRQELGQIHSKLDKVMEMVAASGSHRSVMSPTSRFCDNMERQMEFSTPPPSLNSIPLNYSYHGRHVGPHQDTGSVNSAYKPTYTDYRASHFNGSSSHSGYNLGISSTHGYQDNNDNRDPLCNDHNSTFHYKLGTANGLYSRSPVNGYSAEWSARRDEHQDTAWNFPPHQNGFDGNCYEADKYIDNDVYSGSALSESNIPTLNQEAEVLDETDIAFRKEQERILRQIQVDKMHKQNEEALTMKLIQELSQHGDIIEAERKRKQQEEEALSLKYIQELSLNGDSPDIYKPPPSSARDSPVVSHLHKQSFPFERSGNDFPFLVGKKDQENNDWSKVTKNKRIPASVKQASIKIAEDLEKKRKDDLAIEEWRQNMIDREEKEKSRLRRNAEEGSKVKFIRDDQVIESRPLNNRAQSLSAAPLGDVFLQPRAEKKSLKKRRNQSESQASNTSNTSNSAFEIERKKAANELKKRLERQVTRYHICTHMQYLSLRLLVCL